MDILNQIRAGRYGPQVPGRTTSLGQFALFRRDAVSVAGLSGHPRADQLFYRVWQRHRRQGLEAVLRELRRVQR